MATPAPRPDLGGASPIWLLPMLAIVIGPFVWAIVYGIRHPDSGSPKDEGMRWLMKSFREWIEVWTGRKGGV
ncbi:MAG TPA: hypothetical protein VEU77_06535 [Candidatus Acidoferrales bacterium]|nr:hypothetical protein [Candidatus Acidoferrales bacterium]